jgi:PPK2 family polyphosphate:nucleotide phosphotransferase
MSRHHHPDVERFRVTPGFDLADADADATPVGPQDKKAAAAAIEAMLDEAGDLHERLWAQAKGGGTQALLIVLQGMDTSGKGGASKAVDRMLDPLGFSIVGFGKPTDEEKAHHYLWRIERQLPEPGKVRVFDRSHYESVLVERVRELVPESEWAGRYDEINEWERRLADAGTTVVKLMLHISRDEQKERLLARLADPTKHWKYNPGDVDERALWDDYQAAYADAVTRCSTDHAPWYVVPADRKWYRDWVVASVVLHTLRAMDPQYPPVEFDVATETARVQAS